MTKVRIDAEFKCTISLTEDLNSKDIVVPGLGRFNSVVERKSWGQTLKHFLTGLPWIIIILCICQIIIFYSFDIETLFQKFALANNYVEEEEPISTQNVDQIPEVRQN